VTCERLLAAASYLGPTCRSTDGGHILSMPSPYSDGDLPQVLVRPVEDGWHLDDFGTALGRLYDGGIDANDRMVKSLESIAAAHALQFVDGVLEGTTTDEHLTGALYRFTAALLQAEAVVHLATADPEETFADRVIRWVGDLGADLRARPRIRGRGRDYSVTALAFRTQSERDRGDGTLVQSVNDLRGLEHAFYTFTSLDEDYRPERFLAVVSDTMTKRRADLDHLAEAAYVTDLGVPDATATWLRASDDERQAYHRLIPTPKLSGL
jgi:hypothetical protein